MSESIIEIEKEIILEIFDNVISRFEQNSDIIYSSEKEIKKYLFENARDKDKIWRTSKQCMMYGCDNPSITKSHTIQKSGSLEIISENGHVLTPAFNRSTGQLEILPIGINYASTFPGFCNEHELMFSDFEKKKILTSGEDFSLQIYRTVCREMVIYKHNLEFYSSLLDSYIDFRNNRLMELILIEANKRNFNLEFLKTGKFNFKNTDFREIALIKQYKKMEKHFKQLEKDFYSSFTKHFQGVTKKDLFVWSVVELDIVVPVCLAGIGNFGIKDTNKSRTSNVLSVLQVLPFNDKTFVVMFAPVKHKKGLALYIDKYWQNDVDIINNIETWMTYGSDHWFIKPSVWNNILPEKQKEIINAIWDMDKNIGDRYEIGIFDDLKNHIIKE